MNPRDALRRYLEQRRELGESELVLDSMNVDDVLALLGARGGAAASRDAADDVSAPADHPRLRESTSPRDVVPPPTVSPAPADLAEAGDWRELLRAAGGAPEPRPSPAASRPPSEVPPRAPEPESATFRDAAEEPAPAAPTPAPRAPGAWDIPGVGAPTGLVVGEAMADMFGGPLDQLDSLDVIAQVVAACTRCPLHRTATHAVPGEGNPNAELVVVGEAPGAEEDATGRPFVGASGQLLTKILAAISLSREEVFICNVVKHRPPGNRNPEPDEVAACSPYLVRQLELIRPKAILTLGNFAAQTLLSTKLGISKLRGQVHRYHGIPLVATYHPAALLRNPTWKRPTWEDVQLARRILDRADAR